MTSYHRHLEQLVRDRVDDYRKQVQQERLVKGHERKAHKRALRSRLAAGLNRLAERLEPAHELGS